MDAAPKLGAGVLDPNAGAAAGVGAPNDGAGAVDPKDGAAAVDPKDGAAAGVEPNVGFGGAGEANGGLLDGAGALVAVGVDPAGRNDNSHVLSVSKWGHHRARLISSLQMEDYAFRSSLYSLYLFCYIGRSGGGSDPCFWCG